MAKVKWMAVLAAALALGFSCGCGDDEETDDGGGGGGGGTTSGSFAGTWSGSVCGRGLTMVINQNGNSLSGSYTFTDPTFSDTFSGSLAGTTPPTTARLNSTGGHDWWFELSFGSYNQMSGGFYKAEKGGLVCSVSASK